MTLGPVVAVAFLSGAASLVYQLNWQRSLALVFGVSHYATTTVVLGFFLGFAVGAQVARRLADRTNPFLLMAVLEAIVALYALTAPAVFEGVKALAATLAPVGEAADTTLSSSSALMAVRILLATLAVAVPTVCMGATVPVFLKACARLPGSTGVHAGLVTGINTAGAVAGSLVTTFVMMGNVPGTTQTRLAALLNATACALSLWQWRRAKVTVTAPSIAMPARLPDRRLLVAYALSGAAGLGLELVWNRIVFMSLDHTIFTFALTLTVYLVAYALGSLTSGPLLRWVKVGRGAVSVLMLASLLSAVAGFRAYSMGLEVGSLRPELTYFHAASLVVAAFMFLPVFFMGLAMPLVLDLATRDIEHVGADAGGAQLLNNLGSVAAIIVVGFVLVPLTNTRVTALFCLALLATAAILLGWPDATPRRRFAVVTLALGALLMLPVAIHQGHVRNTYDHLITLREDSSGLWGLDEARPDAWVLRLNGYYENHLPLPPQGGATPRSPLIQGDFLIPAMVKAQLGSVYMVGLGLGIGAYELLKLPDVQRFDAAELSGAAVELAELAWKPYGPTFFADPRFRVVQEDGRAFLEASPRRYDVIISGTNRIFYAGSTHLYSVDYWQVVKRHLAPGGVFQQWLPTYSLDSTLSLLTSFREVFPDVVVLRFTNYIYMIGFRDGAPASLEPLVREAYARAPDVFAPTALPTADDFLGALWAVGPGLDPRIEANRDDLPVCEYSFRGFEEEERALDELMARKVLVPRNAR